MSSYTPHDGEIVIIQNVENGQEWTAKVDHVTKGGRVVAWWRQRTRKGGDSKPRALHPTRERVVRTAMAFEMDAFERGER
jgi:hypothetical protein